MILAQLLLVLWFVLAHFGATVAITVGVLVCWPLCSFMGAVVGTTTMRAVFGTTTPGEADFEAGGTNFGGSAAFLIAWAVAHQLGVPLWVVGTAAICSVAAMVFWYRLVCVSWTPETRLLFDVINCRKCGSETFVSYYQFENPPACHGCGCDLHPSSEQLRNAARDFESSVALVIWKEFADHMAERNQEREEPRGQ